jgi:hypothetical protein
MSTDTPIAIAMIMLRDPTSLAAEDIQETLAEFWPDVKTVEDESGDESASTGKVLALSDETANLIAMEMPVPIPWSELEGPCAASLYWPDAAAEVKQHTTHWIVTVAGDLEPVPLSTRLTQAVAAILENCPTAIGVYWGNATLVIPKEMFLDFANDVLPQTVPMHIWVDFRVGKTGEKTSTGFTTGMKALGHMELETVDSPEPPGELHSRMMSLAAYVVENGPVIRDGDTIGEDADERIRVVYSKSKFGHNDRVMRLDYEKASRKKPWWKLW